MPGHLTEKSEVEVIGNDFINVDYFSTNYYWAY
jgi:hypothetical protein